MVTIKNVSKKYKRKQALYNVNFSIEKNQIVGLVGPNGAGKSTLIRILSGINEPTLGKVTFQTDKADSSNFQISTIFDFNGLYPQLTAYENILLFVGLKNPDIKNIESEVDIALNDMQLAEWKNKRVKEYSKGMLRKLTIVRATITNPDILIMDEPFDGLDIESHRFVIQYLKKWVTEANRCILVSSHNMSDIEEACTKFVMINQGNIVIEKQITDLKKEGFQFLKIRLLHPYNKDDLEKALKMKIESGNMENEIFIYCNEKSVSDIISKLCKEHFEICEVIKECTNLEDIYIKMLKN
ncbi:MAG: ABC transporter ATP-binding protein [Lachnospiraceae bacterium]|nr:ABC transporter ATP-binding protein [Lachnospiraceae bacterium]